jgi:hypothetical protein
MIKNTFHTCHYRPLPHYTDHDPTVYDNTPPEPAEDLLREAGLDTYARGVVRREMADAR